MIKNTNDELRLLGRQRTKNLFELHFKDILISKVIASNNHAESNNIRLAKEPSGSSNDYADRRSIPISIPDYSLVEINNEKFCVSYRT